MFLDWSPLHNSQPYSHSSLPAPNDEDCLPKREEAIFFCLVPRPLCYQAFSRTNRGIALRLVESETQDRSRHTVGFLALHTQTHTSRIMHVCLVSCS